MKVAAFACPRSWVWVLSALVAALVGCGDDQGSTLAARLAGHEYLLESSQGFTSVEGTDVRLFFSEDGDEMSFSAGCNHHSGAFSIEGDRLIVSGFASTEIGCEPGLHEQDDWLSTFMSARPRVEQRGDRLTFEGDEATLAFLDREVAEPDKPLIDVLWTVDTFIDGDAASNVALDQPPTLRFDADGTVKVFTSCREGTGSFQQVAGKLTLSSVRYEDATTCADQEKYADDRVRAVIDDGEVTFAIEANRLTILRDNDRGLGALAE